MLSPPMEHEMYSRRIELQRAAQWSTDFHFVSSLNQHFWSPSHCLHFWMSHAGLNHTIHCHKWIKTNYNIIWALCLWHIIHNIILTCLAMKHLHPDIKMDIWHCKTIIHMKTYLAHKQHSDLGSLSFYCKKSLETFIT